MDKNYQASQDNRTNQCNPTHQPTGPGRSAGDGGAGTRADLNNHANHLESQQRKIW